MYVCDNCSTVRILKVFLVICLSLVLLQYLINLATYSYVTKFLKDDSYGSHNRSAIGLFFPDVSDFFKNLQSVQEKNVTRSASENLTLPSEPANMTEIVTNIPSGKDDIGNLCPLVPPTLVGALATYKEVLSFEEMQKKYPELQAGGRYKPPDCKSRHRVAIIVPYRNREDQLKILLNNLHPVLERQQLDYAIYITEMAMPTTFNRAILMNIGYTEALKDYDFQCFIFHDVDLIPENDRNLYTCPENPRHMSVAIDKFNYKLPYAAIFGGVSALTKEHMIKVNGFSNKYFGWGGEDDDMMKRIQLSGLKLSRAPIELARYKMIKHGRDKANEVNKQRFNLLYAASKRAKKDGLNSLKYEVVKKEYKPTYTWVYVQVNQKEIMKS
ncbi:beta-1,4-N-acetylgalactosaminyltransferase bre-4-like [Haliotis rufescens]|uniref:beta-1,4-N-acetylgalactosaminyltransferase bre-4-like n=1 Tax=Haliotis rufescens TaxID=6454 RepID=UPI001EB06306|nr:beta-1,4-N-acetylgalactosaminyltransferase bre-4-like [Haliotis rufescens]XP_046353913.1 beta-1,4-N-acetylgalactosaminyltransferase bre-4-like [Haliotis rufescens]